MALALLVVLATTQLEDAHLVVLALCHNSGLDASASNQGSANLQFGAVTHGENLVDHDLLANFRSNLFYLDLFASSNFVLLAAGFYDRVHISPFSETTRANRGCRPAPESAALSITMRLAGHSKSTPLKRRARDSSAVMKLTQEGLPQGLTCIAASTGSERGAHDTGGALAGVPIIAASPQSELRVHAQSASSSVQEVLAALDAEMREVDAVIGRRLTSDVALINQIAGYIVHAGGKRMRPKLVLMFANALGFQGPERHELAAVVEFIHTATLLHDDVVDESSLRRGKQTANALFGNAASVLVGDFLYSRAFQMMVSANRMRVLDVLAEATNIIAEGEVLQLMNMHDPDITVDSYLRVIRYKTAKLFEASARLGAVLADSPYEIEEACAAYGRSLGTAFQLIDDVLDYEGDTQSLGKNVGDDLREGKPTLPLLIAMERGSEAQRELIRHAIQHGEEEKLSDIIAIVRETGALEATRDAARQEAKKAEESLSQLPLNKWRESLLEFAAQSVSRSF